MPNPRAPDFRDSFHPCKFPSPSPLLIPPALSLLGDVSKDRQPSEARRPVLGSPWSAAPTGIAPGHPRRDIQASLHRTRRLARVLPCVPTSCEAKSRVGIGSPLPALCFRPITEEPAGLCERGCPAIISVPYWKGSSTFPDTDRPGCGTISPGRFRFTSAYLQTNSARPPRMGSPHGRS
jgi:hypothetical protein